MSQMPRPSQFELFSDPGQSLLDNLGQILDQISLDNPDLAVYKESLRTSLDNLYQEGAIDQQCMGKLTDRIKSINSISELRKEILSIQVRLAIIGKILPIRNDGPLGPFAQGVNNITRKPIIDIYRQSYLRIAQKGEIVIKNQMEDGKIDEEGVEAFRNCYDIIMAGLSDTRLQDAFLETILSAEPMYEGNLYMSVVSDERPLSRQISRFVGQHGHLDSINEQ